MRDFLDRTGQLWVADALVGKVGSVFTSSATQHGGKETTIITFYPTLLHHGMVLVGLPYTCTGAEDARRDHGRLAVRRQHDRRRADGSRQPSEHELGMARFQGEHVARIADEACGLRPTLRRFP